MKTNPIKNSIKKYLRNFATKHAPKINASDPGQASVRVLMYHEVDKNPLHPFSVSNNSFEKQMKYLRDNFQIISINDMYSFLKGELKLRDNAVAVTFDDGLRSIYLNAYPILKKYEIPAMIFLIADYFKSGKDGRSGREFLKPEDVSEMKGSRISFGSHSKNHVVLSKHPKSEVRENIFGSKKDLEEMIEDKIDYFSYPFGLKRHFSKEIENIVREADYKCAFSAINGVNSRNADIFALRRTKIERDDSFQSFQKILKNALDWWAILDRL